jgi:hypothetical protein
LTTEVPHRRCACLERCGPVLFVGFLVLIAFVAVARAPAPPSIERLVRRFPKFSTLAAVKLLAGPTKNGAWYLPKREGL